MGGQAEPEEPLQVPSVALGAVGGVQEPFDPQDLMILDFPLEFLDFVPDASSSEDEEEHDEELPILTPGPVFNNPGRSTDDSLQQELGTVPTIQLDFVAEEDPQEEPRVVWVYEEDYSEDF